MTVLTSLEADTKECNEMENQNHRGEREGHEREESAQTSALPLMMSLQLGRTFTCASLKRPIHQDHLELSARRFRTKHQDVTDIKKRAEGVQNWRREVPMRRSRTAICSRCPENERAGVFMAFSGRNCCKALGVSNWVCAGCDKKLWTTSECKSSAARRDWYAEPDFDSTQE